MATVALARQEVDVLPFDDWFRGQSWRIHHFKNPKVCPDHLVWRLHYVELVATDEMVCGVAEVRAASALDALSLFDVTQNTTTYKLVIGVEEAHAVSEVDSSGS